MAEYIRLTKNSDNQTIYSPSSISVGWGGCISADGKRLRISGCVNFKVLRTAFNRAGALGITASMDGSILLFGAENGIGKGVRISLRDKFLDRILSYVRALHLENKSRMQITDALNKCCLEAAQICSRGERRLTVEDSNGERRLTTSDSRAECDFIDSLADICHSFGYEPVSADITNYTED